MDGTTLRRVIRASRVAAVPAHAGRLVELVADIPTLEDLELEGRRVLVRADLDVMVDEQTGSIHDDSKILAALPTLQHVVKSGARLVIAAHRGRPRGRVVKALSMEPAGSRLAELARWEVFLPESGIGDMARKIVGELRTGQVCLLENLEFFAGEESDDESFVRELARLADVFVADALGALDQSSASTVGLPRVVREHTIGLALRRELLGFERLGDAGSLALLGGSFARQAALLEALLGRVGGFLLGGQLAWTLLAAQGVELGVTVTDRTTLARARTLLEQVRLRKVDLSLPTDAVVAPPSSPELAKTVTLAAIPSDCRVLDLGRETVARYLGRVAQSSAVIWNGPLTTRPGVTQEEGSAALIKGLIESPAFSLVGPDSVALLGSFAVDRSRFGLVTQGGEAARGLLLGKKLPGLEALRQRR